MLLTNVLSAIQSTGRPPKDTDFIDRLHSFLTFTMLMALSILVSFKQFGGQPLECMVPDTFTDAWEEYAEKYCWTQNTYFVPFENQVPRTVAERKKREIGYYQWVPFFLLLEGIAFFLPSLVWRHLSSGSGIRVGEIVNLASDGKNLDPETRKRNMESLAIHLQNALRFHRRIDRNYYICLIYLITKTFYLINVCLQFHFMNIFLETHRYSYYGFWAVLDIVTGVHWEHSGKFPRVTICDFQVRVMGNIQRHSVQCVLLINIFNEKIFVFLWFWFSILALVTAISLIYWTVVIVFPYFGRSFIGSQLELSEICLDPKLHRREIKRFVKSYLRRDGVFVLKMLSSHAGIIYGTELTLCLWKGFYGLHEASSSFSQRSGPVTPPTPWVPKGDEGSEMDPETGWKYSPQKPLKKKNRKPREPTAPAEETEGGEKKEEELEVTKRSKSYEAWLSSHHSDPDH